MDESWIFPPKDPKNFSTILINFLSGYQKPQTFMFKSTYTSDFSKINEFTTIDQCPLRRFLILHQKSINNHNHCCHKKTSLGLLEHLIFEISNISSDRFYLLQKIDYSFNPARKMTSTCHVMIIPLHKKQIPKS